jgi:hypothetical protein
VAARAGWALLFAGAVAGCGGTPTPAGTGAREAVQDYYDALVRRDWPAAYASLDADSRKRCSAEQFTRLAQNYRKDLGFEPDGVHVRACEEHGAEALAHVVLTGRDAVQRKSHKDAVMLRRTGDDWGVVLSPNFGRKRR